jgi:RimJ/RimL family protein N-acetyltransferase
MLPIRTARLTIRMMRDADIDAHVAYRNDPEIARYQAWDVPYPRLAAQRSIDEQADRDRPIDGVWTTMAVELEGRVIGDVVAYLHPGGGVAEIGYTLARAHHGRGYASEAAGAVVDALVAHCGVHRIEAKLDPDNVASMRVVEAIGMQVECVSRGSYFWRGAWVDDLVYSLLAEDRTAWLMRPHNPPTDVALVVIEPDTAHLWGRLRTHHSQERFVSPMAASFRDALFPEPVAGVPVTPWMRGVLADGVRVGFVMCADVTPAHPDPYLWRLLVDRSHQRRGIGTRVVALVAQHYRERAAHLVTSFVDQPGGPGAFYSKLGFVPTGEIDSGEVVTRLSLR